jgi:hypothetical protein
MLIRMAAFMLIRMAAGFEAALLGNIEDEREHAENRLAVFSGNINRAHDDNNDSG